LLGKTEHQVLTRREREVADLVVTGLTNPEIASRLFVSQKTVETHMTNILRKLGVSSRRQIAAPVPGGSGRFRQAHGVAETVGDR
jgi:DNA-binding NarL/FixJ family response regulator